MEIESTISSIFPSVAPEHPDDEPPKKGRAIQNPIHSPASNHLLHASIGLLTLEFAEKPDDEPPHFSEPRHFGRLRHLMWIDAYWVRRLRLDPLLLGTRRRRR